MSASALSPWFVVGLGNPGRAYADHRHSVGFMGIDFLHQTWNFSPWRLKGNLMLSQGSWEKVSVTLLKPLSFMNCSGTALAPFFSFHRKGKWLVVHDELDLPLGCIRLKRDGGTGGHNGLKSLHALWGHQYLRLRVGIGHPPPSVDVADYVLSSFPKHEKEIIQQQWPHLASWLPLLFEGNETLFVQHLHSPALS